MSDKNTAEHDTQPLTEQKVHEIAREEALNAMADFFKSLRQDISKT